MKLFSVFICLFISILPSFALESDTLLSVKLTLADPCQEYVGTTEKILPESAMTVYPNPGEGKFTLSFLNEDQEDKGQLFISDLHGRIIHTEILYFKNPEHLLDLSASPAGIYFIYVEKENACYRKKLIIR